MALGVTSDVSGVAAGWDWKGEYVDRLASGDGYERFSQGSVTPDTTLLFAGPARFSAVADDVERLHPMGLVDNVSFSQNASLQPLYEIGSNRTFFTRGKSQQQVMLNSMLADHSSLLKTIASEAYDMETGQGKDSNYFINAEGTKAPGASDMWMNLDSEAHNLPFGILMVFKTKGQSGSGDLNGNIVGAAYLEYCMLTNFQFNVQAQAPIISENVGIMYDRAVPVAIG